MGMADCSKTHWGIMAEELCLPRKARLLEQIVRVKEWDLDREVALKFIIRCR